MKSKLKLLITLKIFLLFCSNLNAAPYWTRLNSPVSTTLNNVFFINNSTGWLSGEVGVILKTTNGGTNWIVQNSGTFYNIEDIFFINQRLGYALAWEIFPDSTTFQGTIILSTTNGGNIWSKRMYPDTNWFLKTVFFHDSLNGFMGGVPASIIRTTNGGVSWTPTDIDSTLFFVLPIFKIKFFNQQTGYACGGFRDIQGIVWATSNGGLNWKGAGIAPEPFFDLSIIYSNKAIASGGDLEYGSSIARTTNTGVNWFYDTLGVFGLATGIDFRTPAEGWMAAGFSQKFIVSYDSGFTWNSIFTTDSSAIFDLDFTDSIYGYACGVNGVILKYDRTMSQVSNFSNDIISKSFSLEQNYPNPFNPNTIINYELRITNYVTLKAYDILGKEVKSLVDGKQNAGEYSVEFEGANYPSGIYFYELKAGDFSQVKRMLLLK